MSYGISWSDDHEPLSCHKFVERNKLFHTMLWLETRRFYMDSDKDITRLILESTMKMKNHVGKTMRFPEREILVDMSKGVIATAYQSIHSSLDFSEWAIGAPRNFVSATHQRVFDTYMKAILTIKQALQTTNEAELLMNGVLNRHRFEDYHKLVWTEDDEPNAEQIVPGVKNEAVEPLEKDIPLHDF